MFIEINHTNYNVYSISSFSRTQAIIDNGDGTQAVRFVINYALNNGVTLTEVFNDESECNERYEALRGAFAFDVNREEENNNGIEEESN